MTKVMLLFVKDLETKFNECNGDFFVQIRFILQLKINTTKAWPCDPHSTTHAHTTQKSDKKTETIAV